MNVCGYNAHHRLLDPVVQRPRLLAYTQATKVRVLPGSLGRSARVVAAPLRGKGAGGVQVPRTSRKLAAGPIRDDAGLHPGNRGSNSPAVHSSGVGSGNPPALEARRPWVRSPTPLTRWKVAGSGWLGHGANVVLHHGDEGSTPLLKQECAPGRAGGFQSRPTGFKSLRSCFLTDLGSTKKGTICKSHILARIESSTFASRWCNGRTESPKVQALVRLQVGILFRPASVPDSTASFRNCKMGLDSSAEY